MVQLASVLESNQRELAQHPFFARLRAAGGAAKAIELTPAMAFWVLSFQELLRLNEALIEDLGLREVATESRLRYEHHERRSSYDLAALGRQQPGLMDLFSRGWQCARDASFTLASEVCRVRQDRLRLVVLSTLESAGDVFFREATQRPISGERAPDRAAALCESLPDELRPEAEATIQRIYAQFFRMFDELAKPMAVAAGESSARG